MKNLISDKVAKYAAVTGIVLLSIFAWLFMKGLQWEALINIVFQFCVSWLLSYVATLLYLKAYDEHFHLRLWKNLYLFIVALPFIGYYLFPETL